MRNSILLTLAALCVLACTRPALAIPLFAQRYHLQCGACHSVLPELNAFGVAFRAHGYQLSAPKHGTSGVAIRYQMEYEKDPTGGNRRFTPGGILLSNADIGKVSAFVHYNLGAGGGPSGLYLGYLATYNEHVKTLYRLGLFELPLQQSPGQRLDDLAPYGYYAAHVEQNDLPLSSPRWGMQMERTVGSTIFDATVSVGEFKGAAYGGKPVDTGETTHPDQPEIGLFAHTPLTKNVDVGAAGLIGARKNEPDFGATYVDGYRREGLFAHSRINRLDLQAEQWWGRDTNADGFGSIVGSSGGYFRLKYYVTDHAYLAARYDAQAVPFIQRDLVYYAAFHVTPHARLLIQNVQPIGGGISHLGGALTLAVPWPKGL